MAPTEIARDLPLLLFKLKSPLAAVIVPSKTPIVNGPKMFKALIFVDIWTKIKRKEMGK